MMATVARWILDNIITSGTFWSAAGAVATMVASVAIFQAAKQLRFDAWLKAQEIFTDREFVAARTTVYGHLPKPTETWSPTDLDAGLLVCRQMDQLCHLQEFLGRKRILDTWANPLATSWALLKWLVVQERQRASWAKKWSAFETLGEAAIQAMEPKHRARLLAAREQSTQALSGATLRPQLPAGAA